MQSTLNSDRPLDLFLSRLDHPRRTGRSWEARCPAHDDRSPSLNVREDPISGKVLLHCHAGCEPEAILAALGLKWTDLFPADWRRDVAQSVRVNRVALRREEQQLVDRLRQERENWTGPPVSYIDRKPLAERLAVVLRRAVDAGHLDQVDVEHIGRALEQEADVQRLRQQAKAATDAAEAAWAALRGEAVS